MFDIWNGFRMVFGLRRSEGDYLWLICGCNRNSNVAQLLLIDSSIFWRSILDFPWWLFNQIFVVWRLLYNFVFKIFQYLVLSYQSLIEFLLLQVEIGLIFFLLSIVRFLAGDEISIIIIIVLGWVQIIMLFSRLFQILIDLTLLNDISFDRGKVWVIALSDILFALLLSNLLISNHLFGDVLLWCQIGKCLLGFYGYVFRF